MFSKEKRQHSKSIIYNPIFGIFLLFAFVYGLFSVLSVAKKSKEAKENKQQAQEELLTLQERKIDLEKSISQLETESGTEEIIREKFRVVKEGEGMIVILDEEELPEVEKKNFTKRFWDFLVRVF